MKGSLKSAVYSFFSALFYASGYVLLHDKLTGLNKLIIISIYSLVIFVVSTTLWLGNYLMFPDMRASLAIPKGELLAYCFALGVLFSLADIFLIWANTIGGSLPSIITIMTAMTLAFSILINYFKTGELPNQDQAIALLLGMGALYFGARGELIETIK